MQEGVRERYGNIMSFFNNNNDDSDWRKKAYDGRFILFASFALMLFFFVAGNISLLQALMGFFFIAIVILIIPQKSENYPLVQNEKPDIEYLREQTLFDFAKIISDSCIILNEDTNVLFANKSAKEQFSGLIMGKPLGFALRNPDLHLATKQVLKTGKPEKITIHQTITPEKWFEISIALFKPKGRKKISNKKIVLIMHDLTKQQRSQKIRSDFIANVSHELRTPLTSIIGFVETLQGSAANDIKAQKKFLGIMGKQAKRMSKLIDDLLSLSHIELSEHVKPKDKVDLVAIISNVVEGLQNQAREAGLNVKTYLPAKPAIIKGDENELVEVFENLIDNAVKYGEGSKTIKVKLAKISEKAGFDYQVNIIDYGVGISSKHLPRLTERFYRVNAETSRKKKGTGLGLAIVKHILNRHEAKMTINSKINEGTNVELLFKK